jgi:catechol 2,3-dioxygenase-like lactoylglutathione lyase family enzyme
VNLNQVTLHVADVERALAFYRRLGLRLIVDALPRYVRLECPDGGSTLSLEQSTEPGAAPAGERGAVIYFECDDLDGTVERLARDGVAFDSPPTDRPWLWREARLRDPEGNRICLYHAGRNRRFPPWRVG